MLGIDLALGIPATLSIVLIAVLSIFVCNQLQGDFCVLVDIIPAGLSWNCGIDLDILKQWEYVIQVLLLLAELWIKLCLNFSSSIDVEFTLNCQQIETTGLVSMATGNDVGYPYRDVIQSPNMDT